MEVGQVESTVGASEFEKRGGEGGGAELTDRASLADNLFFVRLFFQSSR